VPHAVVTAPKDGAEMLALTRLGLERRHPGPFTVRYPRDAVPAAVPPLAEIAPIEFGTWETLRTGSQVALLATGTMVLPALEAAALLEAEGIDATVVNCRFIKPMDVDTLEDVADRHAAIVTVEEGTEVNGFGSAVARWLGERNGERNHRLGVMGVPDRLIEHASREEQLQEVGLTPAGIATRARALIEAGALAEVRQTA
jgi:1-deoxy-D-xylulose-5-phosphate synthase